MEKKSNKRSKKWLVYLGIAVVLVAVGVFFVYPRYLARTSTGITYQTAALRKGNLTATVGASGNVRTNQTVVLSWQTSGIVSSVLVAKGQIVTADTVLAELDPTSLPLSVINAKTDLATAQKALDDLLSSDSDRAAAQLALIQAEQALVNAQKSAQSKTFQRASQENIDIAQANLIQAQAALDKAADIYNKNKSRSSSDVQYAAALSQFAAAQQKYDSAQMTYQYVTSLPDALSVQEVNAELDVAQAKYLDAKRAWEQIKDGPTEINVAAAQSKVDAAQAVLDQAHISAPISGTITGVSVKPGDLVSGQTTAFQIDDLSHLYVDIQVSEVDISQVQVGQPAAITFDALPEDTYQGVVSDIDMIGTTSSGAVNFYVTVEIMNPGQKIKPGMTASAEVTVTQLNDVLVVPNRAIKTMNAQQIVYVQRNGSITPVPITTGISSGSYTQLVEGSLQEGDLIVTNPPSSAAELANNRQMGIFGGLFGGARQTIRIGGGGAGPEGQGGFNPGNGSGNPGGNSGANRNGG
jgi:HlyD family secretion protein